MDATKVQIIIGEYAKLEFGSKRITKKKTYELIRNVVEEELILLNQKYLEIKQTNFTNKNFKDQQVKTFLRQNEDLYSSDPFRSFIKFSGKKHTEYYDRMLNDCLISQDTFEDFLSGINEPQSKTLDFFNAFTRFVEREHSELINLEPKKLKIDVDKKSEKTKSETNELDLDYLLKYPISYAEELIDAFELGLNQFFYTFYESIEKSNGTSRENTKYNNMFSLFFEKWGLANSLNVDGIIFLSNRFDNYDINSKSNKFENEEVQMVFNIGNKLGHRIYNRIIVELYDDGEELERIRFEIDSDIISISAWLDLEYIYQETIKTYKEINPKEFLNFISLFKGEIRKNKKILGALQSNDFIERIYLFGFESRLDEIINYKSKKNQDDLDSFINDIIKSRSTENIEFFRRLEKIDDLEYIKQKIKKTSLKDYFFLGVIIAQDLIGTLICSNKISFTSIEEFEQVTIVRNSEEIKNAFLTLNLGEIYSEYMPVLIFENGKSVLKGNYNVLLIKVLKSLRERIKGK
jgi:hypothetical protein